MAIKKGAFDLYTQERKLPEKRSVTNKSSHFFDDIDKEIRSVEMVHERFTTVTSVLANTIEPNDENLQSFNSNKGSQTVHVTDNERLKILNKNLDISITSGFVNDENNGSQVREQFTSVNAIASSNELHHDNFQYSELNNSSQTVHNIDNEQSKILNENLDILTTNVFSNNENNGSQMVHERFADRIVELGGVEKNKNLSGLDNVLNGSQTVHKRFITISSSPAKESATISFSKIIGIQRAVVIALYKNMKFNKSDTTNELTLEAIASLSGVNQKSLKNTLFRLSSTGVILRADQKNGRGGWVKYKISHQILEDIQKNEFSILKK